MLIISCIFLMLLRVLIETQQNIAIFPKILYIFFFLYEIQIMTDQLITLHYFL